MGPVIAAAGGLALGGGAAAGVAWVRRKLKTPAVSRRPRRDVARDVEAAKHVPQHYRVELGDNANPELSIEGAGAGAATGALTGAAIGTAVPIIGNAVGAVVGAVVGGLVGLFGEWLAQEHGEDIIRERIVSFARSNGFPTNHRTIDYLTHLAQVVSFPGRLAFRVSGSPRGQLGLIFPMSDRRQDGRPSRTGAWAATHFLEGPVRQYIRAIERSRGWDITDHGIIPSPSPGILPLTLEKSDRTPKHYLGTPHMKRSYLEAHGATSRRQDWTLVRPADSPELVVLHAEHAALALGVEIVA